MEPWAKAIAIALPAAAVAAAIIAGVLLCRRRWRDSRPRHAEPRFDGSSGAAAHLNPVRAGLAKVHVPYVSNSVSRASLRFHHLHPFAGDGGTDDSAQVVPLTSSAWHSPPRWVMHGGAAHGDVVDGTDADVSPGRMQAVRLKPDAKNRDGGGGTCSAQMNVALPVPDAYFEITVMYFRAPGVDGAAMAPAASIGSTRGLVVVTDAAHSMKESPVKTKEHKSKAPAIAVGLGNGANKSPALPGTYRGSIGFHSDGAVHLDGMKLVYESESAQWAGVDRVIGCGFELGRRRVTFTVDGQLVHIINCNSDAYSRPLYPVLASNADAMVIVNLGQSRFRYAPENARRMTAASNLGHLRLGSGEAAAADCDDSGELFSVGRVDSGWSDNVLMGKRERDGDTDGELFEIHFRD